MRGFYGIGIYHAKFDCNQGTLWRSAHAFGASFCFTVGRRFERQSSDTTQAWRHTPFFEYDTLESLLKQNPYSCMVVGVELSSAAKDLRTFCHPERAIYLLGAEDHGLPPRVLERCHLVVQIPAVKEICLNVSVAGSILMYDRLVKSGYAAEKVA